MWTYRTCWGREYWQAIVRPQAVDHSYQYWLFQIPYVHSNFDHFYQPLMGAKSKRSKTHKQDKRNTRGLRFHLAEDGDVLIQPACYAHCVLTGRAFAADGSTRWALVHG